MEKKQVNTIPEYVLRKMLRKGCASITDDGLSIKFINEISPFLLTIPTEGMHQDQITFKFDDQELDPKNLYIRYQDIETQYLDFTPLDGYRINLGDEVELIYKGSDSFETGTGDPCNLGGHHR